jgi:hypothetical protein
MYNGFVSSLNGSWVGVGVGVGWGAVRGFPRK